MPFEAKELIERAKTFRGVYEVEVRQAKHVATQTAYHPEVPEWFNWICNIYAVFMYGLCVLGVLALSCFLIGAALLLCL